MIYKKFRPQEEFKELNDNDEFFVDLPKSCIFNVMDYMHFQDYVYSDMMIESIRAAKVYSVTNHVRDPKLKHDLEEYALLIALEPDDE